MRIDIVTIFPEFFSVLDVSLLGKARSGKVDERDCPIHCLLYFNG